MIASAGVSFQFYCCPSLEHLPHFSSKSSIWLPRLHHQTDCFARSLYFMIPLCRTPGCFDMLPRQLVFALFPAVACFLYQKLYEWLMISFYVECFPD